MNIDLRVAKPLSLLIVLCTYMTVGSPLACASSVQKGHLVMSRSEYLDRVNAIWMGQMVGQLTGLLFEHKPASVLSDTPLVHGKGFAETDDDYYYEMVAIRAFEKYGINLTVEQLGDQWLENSAGSWGSSAEALALLKRGVKAPDTGNPRYNRLWWTIGPQFSTDVYGTLAPGMPNVAAAMARRLTHVNGYAEGTDGAVFVSGMISLGFVETDTKEIVRKAASLISPLSPYRQCLDMVISMAEAGKQPEEIFRVINERWGIEYPATNNAVVNGGIVATSVWFGNGNFSQTENLALTAADFADTDCNAANAASVVGAMHGMSALPAELVASFNDRLRGVTMGGVPLTPPVDESILALGERTAVMLGEIRGAEAFDLLQLLNTGHSGTLSTVHANSALQAISRFTSCVLQSNVELPYRAIKSNIADSLNLLVHVERRPGTRFVSEVSEIVRYNSDIDRYDLNQLFVRAEAQ